jgi:hypothetical protein
MPWPVACQAGACGGLPSSTEQRWPVWSSASSRVPVAVPPARLSTAAAGGPSAPTHQSLIDDRDGLSHFALAQVEDLR